MTDYKKLMSVKLKLITLCKCFCLTALFLCACSELPDHCGDNNKFNSSTHFCFNDETIAKCGGNDYDPPTEFCSGGAVMDKCGGTEYSPVTQFCYGDTTVAKCGGNDYDPPTQRCVADAVLKRCADGGSVPLGDACEVYTLTTAVNTVGGTLGGTVLVNGAELVGVTSHDSGTTVTVRAETAVGYTFTGWSGASSSTNTTVTIVMNGEKELTANFKIKKYKLTTVVFPADTGTVSRNPALEEYDHGTVVIVTATPATGYAFARWTGALASIAHAEVITMDDHKTLVANFELIPVGYHLLDIDRNPVAGGTVSSNPYTSSYADGTAVTVTATPNTGYRFIGWSMASTDTSRTVTITMNADRRLIANFEQIFMLTINRNPEIGGAVTPASGLRHDANTPVTITATPTNVYDFVNWTVTSGTAMFTNASDSNTSIILSSDATIRANFKGGQFNPNITYGYVTDSRDGQRYRTVRIGNQSWMAENLNYDVPTTTNDICYGNTSSNCTIYGRLYDWATAMAGTSSSSSSPSGRQGICPAGWHVPSDGEWTTLVNFAGGSATAGKKLKSMSSLWTYNATHVGTDDYGFSALPSGDRWNDGIFYLIGDYGSWWSATQNDATNVRRRYMYYK